MKPVLFLALFILLTTLTSAKEEKGININLNLEECEISILTNKEIYEPKEQIVFYNNLTIMPKEFEITYQITTLNNTIIKKPVTTKNLNKKTFTPKETNYDQILIIKNSIYSQECDSSSEKRVIVKANPNLIISKTVTKPKEIIEPIVKPSKVVKPLKERPENTNTTIKSYKTPLISSKETFLNPNPQKNITSAEYNSAKENSGDFAKYALFGAIALFIIGTKKNGIQNKIFSRSRRVSSKSC